MAFLPSDPPITPTNPAPTLTFPPLTYAKLFPSSFLAAHLARDPPIRPNGRLPASFRPVTAHAGALAHPFGSAVVRIGDTSVVCGVRGEILLTSNIPNPRANKHPRRSDDGENHEKEAAIQREERNEIANLGLLVPNVDLSTGCSPAYMPNSPPSVLAQGLSQRLLALLDLSAVINMDDLRIWYDPPKGEETMDMGDGPDEEGKPEVKAYWTLIIDILFISLDGNPFDAAWAVVLAALQNTKLPQAEWDTDRQMVLCDDPVSAKPLRIRGFPVAATFVVFDPTNEVARTNDGVEQKARILADPDDFEESLCEEEITVVVKCVEGTFKVLRIEKSGGGFVGVGEMKELVKAAEGRWKEWKQVLVDGG